MRQLSLVLALLLLPTFSASCLAADKAGKSKTIVWQGTIPVAKTFTVPKGTTLEVRPGTRVIFSKGVSLVIQGALRAIGQKGQEIVFTTKEKKTPSRWHEIMFEEAAESRMEHCLVESAQWGVHSHETRLTIFGCTFRGGDVGLRFRGGPLSVRQSRFADNGVGLRSYQGEGSIAECEFTENEIGLFVREKGGGLTITGNNFFGNRAYNIRVGDFNDEDVKAPDNWWGGNDPAATIFDGRNEPGIGRVLFEPFSRQRLAL
mgnify:CR=1 FL=1